MFEGVGVEEDIGLRVDGFNGGGCIGFGTWRCESFWVACGVVDYLLK